jgi:cell division septation protein DedD
MNRLDDDKPPISDDEDDLFFRAEDRNTCEQLCAQIVADGMSLAIIGSNQACSHHYCRMVIKRLSAFTEVRLEIHSPENTEDLLDRFNAILASMSMTEAMAGRSSSSPLRILISSGSEATSPAEWRLLARLSGFPGANTQLILLQTTDGDLPQEKPVEFFGKRLLRWDIAAPSKEEALALLTAARPLGREHAVMTLLQTTAPELLEEPFWDVLLNQTDLPRQAPRPEMSSGNYHPPAAVEKSARRTLPALLTRIVVAVTLVSFGLVVMALLFPQQTETVLSSLGAYAPQAASPVAVEPVAAPPAPPAPSSLATAPSVPTPTIPEPAAPADIAPRIATELAPPPGEARLTPPAPPPPVAASNTEPIAKPLPPLVPQDKAGATNTPRQAEAPPAVVQAIEPQSLSALRANAQTVRATPKLHIFVQHVALDSYSEAQNWQKARPALAGSLIVSIATAQGKQIKYVVVSGPFSSSEAANTFSKRKDIPPQPWLRTADSLIAAIPAEKRP